MPDTGSLQEKAAELADKLKAAQAAQGSTETTQDGNSESLAALAVNLVTSLESAQEDAAAILALTSGVSTASLSINEPPIFESEVSLDFAAMAPCPALGTESETVLPEAVTVAPVSSSATESTVEVGDPSAESADTDASADPVKKNKVLVIPPYRRGLSSRSNPNSPVSLLSRSVSQNSFSVNHRGLAVRSLSSSNVSTAVSPRGELNQSQSFVTGPKRMNSTKVEPVEHDDPKSRIALPRSPSAQNSSLQADIQAAATATAKAEHSMETREENQATEIKTAVVARAVVV